MSKFPELMTRWCMVAAAGVMLAAPQAQAQAQAPRLEENPAPMREGGYGLGKVALPEEIAAWDFDVRPDGAGLPEGQGDVATGEEIYNENCAMCHGVFGEGEGRWPVLAGGQGSLTEDRPVKTIGSYWPYLSTVHDYVNRAMPFMNSKTLDRASDVYALTAYLLYLNDLVDEDFVLSRDNFTDIHLPNEKGFYPDDRLEVEFPLFTREPCMTNCKDEVKITMRAAVLDVTPEDSDVVLAGAQGEEGTGSETGTQGDGDGGAAGEDAAAEAEAEAPESVPEAAPEAAPAYDPELAARGKKVFRKCKSCHQVGEGAKNRVGPVLTDVVGRPAAAVEGFRYSKAMKKKAEEGLTWTEENLAAFLRKPRGFIKGTKMSFAGLKKDDDVAAIIEYLKSVEAMGK